MNAPQTIEISEFEEKAAVFLTKLIDLDDDITLQVDTDLIEQIGLDSIEAFDAVATMHELIDEAIPDDFDARVVSTIRTLCNYVESDLGNEAVERFMELDLDELDFSEDDDEL